MRERSPTRPLGVKVDWECGADSPVGGFPIIQGRRSEDLHYIPPTPETELGWVGELETWNCFLCATAV